MMSNLTVVSVVILVLVGVGGALASEPPPEQDYLPHFQACKSL